jgi:hypothetical protein
MLPGAVVSGRLRGGYRWPNITGSGPVHKTECWDETRLGVVGANRPVLKRDVLGSSVGRTVDHGAAIPDSPVRSNAVTTAGRTAVLRGR